MPCKDVAQNIGLFVICNAHAPRQLTTSCDGSVPQRLTVAVSCRRPARFTWDVIRRAKSGRAVVLTTHSMEEADLLADDIAIMAAGRLAAHGSPPELKARHGVGYTLTLARRAPERCAPELGRSFNIVSVNSIQGYYH